ncbi:unnamed protein product, partial [Iphiclides podalirius]
MFGIRTPKKRIQGGDIDRSPPQIVGPSQKELHVISKVRRSIGEWEKDGKESDPATQGRLTKQIPVVRTKPIAGSSTSRTSLEREGGSPDKVAP